MTQQKILPGSFRPDTTPVVDEPGEHCLPMSRVMRITLDPEQETVEEREHYRTCFYCLRALLIASRSIVHPDGLTLRRYANGKLDDQTEVEIKAHLEHFRCRLCRNYLEND